MTDALIARLAQDLKPVPPNALLRLLGVAAAAGLLVSTVAMMSWLGLRSDLGQAVATASFWIKSLYTLGLGLLGAWAASRTARPGEGGRLPLALVLPVVMLIVVGAGVSYALAPPEQRWELLMGASALVCPFYILALSMPLLVAMIVFMRRMAPTHLTLAGLSAGLMAGALGAWVYSFHCPESGVPFLALWYSLGIAAAMSVGALAARVLLRW